MLSVVLIALLGFAAAEDAATQTRDAFLVVSKAPQSMYAVENMEFVIEYGVYNTGDRAAKKVTLNDQKGFPTQAFEIVKGMLNVRFESIAPGANVTHSVVVKPLQYGVFNHTVAEVSYTSEGSADLHVGTSTTPGEGYIYRQKEYERRFSAKYPYWAVFAVLIAPTTLGSFFIYYSSKSRYEELSKKKL